MTPHQIGQELRRLIQHQQVSALEPRRLQAVLNDLCSADHHELAAPLTALVTSRPFHEALLLDPTLADGRHLQLFNQVLAEIYAVPLLAQLQPVLEGLLNQAPGSAASPPKDWPQPGPTWSTEQNSAPQTTGTGTPPGPPPRDQGQGSGEDRRLGQQIPARSSPHPTPRGNGVLIVLLAGLCGVLASALGVMGVLLWQRHQGLSTLPPPASSQRQPMPPTPTRTPEPRPDPAAETPSPTESSPAEATTPTPTPEAGSQERIATAETVVRNLYAALSEKDYGRASSYRSEAVAFLFEPGFFNQFERVEVLELTADAPPAPGANTELNAVIRFDYPDGSWQTEKRRFSVDTSLDPPQIVESAFAGVLKAK